jgi:hypothetical protein
MGHGRARDGWRGAQRARGRLPSPAPRGEKEREEEGVKGEGAGCSWGPAPKSRPTWREREEGVKGKEQGAAGGMVRVRVQRRGRGAHENRSEAGCAGVRARASVRTSQRARPSERLSARHADY